MCCGGQGEWRADSKGKLTVETLFGKGWVWLNCVIRVLISVAGKARILILLLST